MATFWDHPYSVLLKSSGFSVGITSKNPIFIIEKKIKDMHHGYLHVKTSDIHFFVVHLSPFKYKVRNKEAKILIDKIKPIIQKKERVIICGDFNALSIRDKKILDKQPNLINGMAATDKKYKHVKNLNNSRIDFNAMDIFFKSGLYDVIGDNLPFKENILFTIPTGIWSKKKEIPSFGERVDYILAGPLLKTKLVSGGIPKKGVLNDISDHYPVVAEFDL